MDIAKTHTTRIADLLSRLSEATSRFTARLERAGERGERTTTGWSPAQIGAHVALVNNSFASVIDGSAPVAAPPAADFTERDWAEIASAIPPALEAPSRLQPPSGVTTAEAVAMVRESAARLAAAITALTPERGAYCFNNRIVGTVTLYQTAEWAIAHTIRHNQQAKRLLDDTGTLS
jgi:hypothetical protein